MNPEQQYQGHRIGMVAGGMVGGGAAVPTPTLAARLERAAISINQQCYRIEEVLAKINGTPRGQSATGGDNKIATTAPLSQSVETVEQYACRLTELAGGLELIA